MRAFDRRLLRYAGGTARALLAAGLLAGATAALAVGGAALLANAIAGAVASAGPAPGGAALAGLAAILAGRAAVAWAREALAYRASASVKSELRRRLLARAATLGPRWASEASTGEVVMLATRGLDALDAYYARYLPQLVLAAIVPPVVVVALAGADVVAALTVALTVPLIPLFMALAGRATEALRERRWVALGRLSHYFLDVVGGLPTLRVFGRSRAQLDGLARATDEYRRESLATLRVAFLSAFTLELGATLSVALVAVGVGLRLVTGDLDLRTGLFVLVLAPEAYLPLRQLGVHYHASQEGLAAAGAAFAIVEAAPPAGGTRIGVPDLRSGVLRVECVTVRHADRELDAPCRASLTVRPGEIVGVAGPSGAGKTTLLLAILGLLPADEGRIEIAGPAGSADIAGLDGDAWRRHVAWVPQQPFLFAGTVAENVRLAAPAASDTAVVQALGSVGLAALDPAMVLGERGAGLSSGERRRVGVARALLRDADLLLLDEPTAGLDDSAEEAVLRAVRDASRRGVAVVLVAHRPAALAIAGRVVTVESRIVPDPPGVRAAAPAPA